MRVRRALLRVALLLSCAIGSSDASSGLVGPGAMAPFSGGGGGGRRGPTRYMRVNDPAVGFFVGGSKDEAMNGLYARTETLPESLATTKKKFSLLYLHAASGYSLAFAESPREPDAMEWVFMDAAGHDRVALFENALIPPAGDRWTHVRAARAPAKDASGWFGKWRGGNARASDDKSDEDPSSSDSSSESRVERSSKTQSAADDEFDELPWQLIAVLSEDMLAQLARQQRRHDNQVNRALNCHPPTPPRHAFVVVETSPPEAALAEAARVAHAADARAAEEDHDAAAEAYAAAMEQAGPPGIEFETTRTRDHPDARVAAWTRSILSFRRGASLRRVGRLAESAGALRDALATAPNFADALFESALASLDAGKFSDAFDGFERLACADRAFPDLQRWMTRARARELRGEARAVERTREWARAVRRAELETRLARGATRFCRAWRQTGSCSADGEREEEKDASCLESTKNGQSGFCECSFALRDASAFAAEASSTGFARETLEKRGGFEALDAHDEAEVGPEDARVLAEASGNATHGARFGCAHGDGPSCASYCETAWRVATRRVESLARAMSTRLETHSSPLEREEDAAAATRAVVEAAARLGALADAEEATDASTDASTSSSAAAAVLGKDDVADRSDLYLVLDLPADFTESELKSRYRRASLSSHPDKPSGSQRAFQRVAEAYQVLGDPEAREAYDLGLGLGEPRDGDAPGDTTLWEEVEREFFPEVHGWRPFGDPHERKRESAAARARSREFRERYGEL